MERRDDAAATGPLLLLLEPDPWRAESLTALLRASGYRVAAELPGREAADVVLSDLAWPGPAARLRLERLLRERPGIRVVAFLPALVADVVLPSLRLGVKGVLALDARPDELLSALRCVLGGSLWAPRSLLSRWVEAAGSVGPCDAVGRPLTRAERRVLEGLLDDLTNKEIGRRLGVTESTVKFHVGKLLRKSGCSRREELARSARSTLLEPFPGPEPRGPGGRATAPARLRRSARGSAPRRGPSPRPRPR